MSKNEKTKRSGPFLVPVDEAIQEAGFACKGCKQKVQKAKLNVQIMVSRMVFYTCNCGTVITWDDERQPANSKIWRYNMNLLKQAGCEIAIFNGNKDLKGFQGSN